MTATIYLHPAASTSPERVASVERATGRVAVIRDHRVELITVNPAFSLAKKKNNHVVRGREATHC